MITLSSNESCSSKTYPVFGSTVVVLASKKEKLCAQSELTARKVVVRRIRIVFIGIILAFLWVN